jgi:hypothetical protein
MKRFLSVTSVLLAVAGSANATSVMDNDAPLICAAVDLASCVPGDGCKRETSDSINAPQRDHGTKAGRRASLVEHRSCYTGTEPACA